MTGSLQCPWSRLNIKSSIFQESCWAFLLEWWWACCHPFPCACHCTKLTTRLSYSIVISTFITWTYIETRLSTNIARTSCLPLTRLIRAQFSFRVLFVRCALTTATLQFLIDPLVVVTIEAFALGLATYFLYNTWTIGIFLLVHKNVHFLILLSGHSGTHGHDQTLDLDLVEVQVQLDVYKIKSYGWLITYNPCPGLYKPICKQCINQTNFL